MQIVIPMSGFGERFRRAGYKVPKPLIEVEGKTIIQHVVEMFSSDDEFIFVCNELHLINKHFNLRSILKKIAPKSKIVSIKPHKKGPSFAISMARKFVKMNKPIIVNYCDFTCYWSWKNFKKFANDNNFDGIIPAYKDFHPHSLGKTNYAYIKEKKFNVIDIQEKKPFTSNKSKEFASSGTYYFSSAKLLFDAIKYQISNGLNINGEFYTSLAYHYLLNKKKTIKVYPLQHFMQWGTPEDLDDYIFWSKTFHNLLKFPRRKNYFDGNLVIPMAGFGSRFINSGFKKLKPLLEVSGDPMVIQATKDIEAKKITRFILRGKSKPILDIEKKLLKEFDRASIKKIFKKTEGQASTSYIGSKSLDINSPVTFGVCDTGVIFNLNAFKKIINSKSDIVVWGIRDLPKSKLNPEMFGWINTNGTIIKNISVKKPINKNTCYPIVLGIFTFKKLKYFLDSYDQLISKNDKVNNEYYLDSLINHSIKLGYRCEYFNVESVLSWGTPEDYNTFNYWQSCFHKWKGHPYTLKKDSRVNKKNYNKLNISINKFRALEKLVDQH